MIASRLIQESATLQTARGRLLVFILLSTGIFVVPYSWLGNLSLWQALGWETAPSIGLTRAYWLVLHGDIIGAWHRNALIYVVLLVGIPLLIKDIYTLRRVDLSQNTNAVL